MNDISRLWERINKLNIKILDLLNQQASLVNEINKLKDITDSDYYDPTKNEKMFMEIINNNSGPLPDELVKEIFSVIFKASFQYKERKLLVSLINGERFKNIHELFNVSVDFPIIIAGPCSIESTEYLEDIAQVLCEYNIKCIRGGTYKPRTSPYDFQGLKKDGLKILQEVSQKYGLISVTEVVDTRDVELVREYADIIQIGARNMQNYELLKEIGQANCPVILKRGMSASIDEFIYAAEYIALQGNRKIILCERGIRTFETKTRNTLDILFFASENSSLLQIFFPMQGWGIFM